MSDSMDPFPSDKYFSRKKASPNYRIPFEDFTPLFPEEFIKVEGGMGSPLKRIPNTFPTQHGSEPGLTHVLGHPLPDVIPSPDQDPFLNYIVGLLNVVRRYNRALYRYRRARFLIDGSDLKCDPMPDLPDENRERFGFPPVDPDPTLFKQRCTNIDEEFEISTVELSNWINGKDRRTSPPRNIPVPGSTTMFYHFDGYVDAVSVNGYILSVRIAGHVEITTDQNAILAKKIVQYGYQSSSHNSVSSANSSVSPAP